MTDCKYIRNFSIIAHIDHGKSTLADRLLEKTGTVASREMKEQLLDDMALERQRGITIKARAVAMHYTLHGQEYELNLVDTPGHVDFQYEVSRSLACCEGAMLLVDAFQGVEAQTVANAYAAMDHNLTIVPVLNKVDLRHARPEEVMAEMESVLAIDPADVLPCSGKTGVGVEALLAAIIDRVPPPSGDPDAPLQAMVFDSHYDEFRGAITYMRIMNGTVRKGQKIRFLRAGTTHEVLELGQFVPQRRACDTLSAGQVGYIICNIKSLGNVHVGDTVSVPGDAAAEALPGYRVPQRMVYCGLYPSDGQDFEELRDSLTKLSVNDPSFSFEPETSDALGFGFRCGFLGLLHMEIIQQRLEQEADLDLVQTAPNVTYEVLTTAGETLSIHNPQDVPEAGLIEEFKQPIVKVNFVLPTDNIGPVMQLCTDRRGVYVRTEYLSPTRAMLTFNLPLAEVIYDMHDKLKSITRGYGTMDYELIGYFPAELVRLDILVGGKRVDALSIIVDRRDADRRGRAIVKKLRTEIDRHMFEIALQAAIGTRVIARETISAMRKNVTAKCYGGDITRKRKLWAKQKEGKKRMKSIGSVDIPQKAFLAVLDTGAESSAHDKSRAMRRFLDTLVLLAAGGIIVHAWLLHGWLFPDVVANSSMAPALRGPHRLVVCRGCGLRFACDSLDLPPGAAAVCLNCGTANDDLAALPGRPGDRLIVDRATWAWRRPARWDMAVLHDPADPRTLLVKRVVGLPGETIEIRAGDIYVDGQIAHKSLAQLKRMAILVHSDDHRVRAGGSQAVSRWRPEHDRTLWSMAEHGWTRAAGTPEGAESATAKSAEPDWLVYHHRQSPALHGGQAEPGPILDDYAYNAQESRQLNPVGDRLLRCRIQATGAGELWLRIGDDRQPILLRIAAGTGQGKLLDGELHQGELSDGTANGPQSEANGLPKPAGATGSLPASAVKTRVGKPLVAPSVDFSIDPKRLAQGAVLELALVDERVLLAVDGKVVLEHAGNPPAASDNPLAIGATGTALVLSGLEVLRDVYYLPAAGIGSPTRPSYQLGPDQYFLLGDNSPVSLDSRHWASQSHTAGVPGNLLLGRVLTVLAADRGD